MILKTDLVLMKMVLVLIMKIDKFDLRREREKLWKLFKENKIDVEELFEMTLKQDKMLYEFMKEGLSASSGGCLSIWRIVKVIDKLFGEESSEIIKAKERKIRRWGSYDP